MNPEVKKLWVTALTDGSYTQGRDRLRTDKGFCCLGVLCNLYAKETGKGEWKRDLGDWAFFTANDLGVETTNLPNSVAEWADLAEYSTKFTIGGNTEILATHNDGSRELGIPHQGFAAIAKAIEEQA